MLQHCCCEKVAWCLGWFLQDEADTCPQLSGTDAWSWFVFICSKDSYPSHFLELAAAEMRFWLSLRDGLVQMWCTGVLCSTFPFGLPAWHHLRICVHSLEAAWWWMSTPQWTKLFLLRFHSKEHFKMWQMYFDVLPFGIVIPSGV